LEPLSNLIWAGVTLALCTWWFAGQGGRHRDSLLPGVGVQLLALLVLSAVLLPVISLTDDRLETTNPAEIERFSRRGDLQPSADPPLQRLPVTLALPGAPFFHPQMPAVGVLPAEPPLSQQTRGFSRAHTTRPPLPA